MKRTGAKIGVCLLLLFVSSMGAIHAHGPMTPGPASGADHCLLCMAAHLPLAASPGAALAVLVFTAALPLPAFQPDGARAPLSVFSLYMRPPPLG